MKYLNDLGEVRGLIHENLAHLKEVMKQCLDLVEAGERNKALNKIRDITLYCGRIKDMELKEEVISHEVEHQIEKYIHAAIELVEKE